MMFPGRRGSIGKIRNIQGSTGLLCNTFGVNRGPSCRDEF